VSPVPLYDAFSDDYDRFVDWPARLAFELPFLRGVLESHHARRVLDTAGGTGQHAIALAAEGYEVTMADLSEGMVARARSNAIQSGVSLRVVQAGFGELVHKVGGRYHAVLCLGNSLPHALTRPALDEALADMAAVLMPGGVIVIQSRNFDRVLARRERFMPAQGQRVGDAEWLFFRFYDDQSPLLRFNVVRLQRAGDAPWSARVDSTLLHPWRHDELVAALEHAGVADIRTLGSVGGEEFDVDASGDLILLAEMP